MTSSPTTGPLPALVFAWCSFRRKIEAINPVQFKQPEFYWNLLHEVRSEQLKTPFNLYEYNYLSLVASNIAPPPDQYLTLKYSVPTLVFTA